MNFTNIPWTWLASGTAFWSWTTARTLAGATARSSRSFWRGRVTSKIEILISSCPLHNHSYYSPWTRFSWSTPRLRSWSWSRRFSWSNRFAPEISKFWKWPSRLTNDFYRERDSFATALFEPSFGDELRDLEPLLLGERDFRSFLEAMLPLLDLACSNCSLGLFDFTESMDFERLLDARAGDCGDGDRSWVLVSPDASNSRK